ncbi:PAN domain-containing protein [Rhodoplanes sp. SY1]|uniref:PAN domain-containing protein n=1 Tax=Rhodoplanes sp. SY1 TaxID=3166646 RepID=UPI0038B4281E
MPPNRADYSFGDLVYWHLFVYGTRPQGDPSAKAGRKWEPDAICRLIGITEKTLRNWIADKHQPDSIVDLERELFGENPAWDDQRLELAEALRITRARKRGKAGRGFWPSRNVASPPLLPGPSAGGIPGQQPADDRKSSERTGATTSLPVVSGSAPRADKEPGGKGSGGSGSGSGSNVPGGTPSLKRGGGHTGRNIAALAVTGLTVVLGMYVWSYKPTLRSPASAPAPPEPPGPAPVPPPSPPPLPKAEDKPTPPPLPPKSEDEQRAETERRIVAQTIDALKAAHDREVREREEEAKRRDREGPAGAEARAQRDREWNARQVAGMGYRLLEYASVTGTSIGMVQTETVYDCALSCMADRCDAFAWFRDERPVGPRSCSRFKAPVTLYENTGYTAGRRVSDVRSAGPPAAAEAPVLAAGGTSLAQASPRPIATPENDGVTRCPNGPVKVTGFRLTCDQTLMGGTTLGSTRLSWTVANINECAEKCRPVKNCVGFTFNAAATSGHSCILFGPTPEKRAVPGWISGER